MSSSTIDGAIEAVDIGRRRRKFTTYKSIRFRRSGGAERTVKNALVADGLTQKIVPGASGRFYLFSAFGSKGIDGFRGESGDGIFAWPLVGNEKLMMILFLVTLVFIPISLATTGDVALGAVVAFVIGGLGWYFYRKSRVDSRRQFDADSVSGATAEPAAPAPPTSPA